VKIAFVVQRYGLEVNGGAEQHCRMVAEHLATRDEVEAVTVFTTCAKEYTTWANHFSPGVSHRNGVTIERHPVVMERRRRRQRLLGAWLKRPHPDAVEQAWLEAQGPVCPGLLDRLSQVDDDYDAFVFFTYLYYPTVMGLERVRRSVLVPTAHDEPPIRHRIFRKVFHDARAFAFNTAEERDFVASMFDLDDRPQSLVGCGVELLPVDPEVSVPDEDFVLYLGRLTRAKGIFRLMDAWKAFKRKHPRHRNLRLALAGGGDVRLPKRDDVVRLGFVDEAQKASLLSSCRILMMPSHFESLSLVMLEAWTFGRPVLVDAHCEVTAGHVERSKGGRVYKTPGQFADALAAMLDEPDELGAAGQRGRAYVEANYRWPIVEDKLLELIRRL